MSTLWEYGPEAMFEPVSIQDLIVTPVIGFLVGEYLFAPLRERILAKRGELDWSDKFLLGLTDPLGVLNWHVDQLFGVKTSLQLMPVGIAAPAPADGSSLATPGSRGPFSHVKPAWGIQFRAQW
jgi:hypothetical protein